MTVRTLESTVVADGFIHGEGPRWHDGRFWDGGLAIIDGQLAAAERPPATPAACAATPSVTDRGR
jgi:hypothetical protein